MTHVGGELTRKYEITRKQPTIMS